MANIAFLETENNFKVKCPILIYFTVLFSRRPINFTDVVFLLTFKVSQKWKVYILIWILYSKRYFDIWV